LIDGLRKVRGNAKDLVLPPSGSDEMVFLARRLGMLFSNWLQGAEDLEQKTHTRMKHIHERFLKQFSLNKHLDSRVRRPSSLP
jgi:glutamate-ammonia-ligase adenylyltransferase